MLRYKKNILLSILPLIYINAVFAENDLVWDGNAGQASKYLFFAPIEGVAKPVYQPRSGLLVKSTNFKKDDLKKNINNFDVNMVKIFGGCVINSQTLKTDLLSAEKCVDDFYISDSEITNAQYNKFLLAIGKNAKAGNGQAPVVNISWQEAVDFTKWLSEKHQKNYMLPSTIQWQYAANTDGASTQQEICNQANAYACKEDAQSALVVKSLASNKWALYDIYGNVWEWVIDASEQEKTAKGGSWRSSGEIFDLNHKVIPNFEKSEDIGFRVVGVK